MMDTEMTTSQNLVTCIKCGWVHMPVTREFAEASVADFNSYFDTLTKDKQDDYYGGRKSSLNSYLHCLNCGGPHTNFRPTKEGDCPMGCTIGPIIQE